MAKVGSVPVDSLLREELGVVVKPGAALVAIAAFWQLLLLVLVLNLIQEWGLQRRLLLRLEVAGLVGRPSAAVSLPLQLALHATLKTASSVRVFESAI
jgi:hypothetical protein